MQQTGQSNADQLQSAIGDDLFPQVQNISDVKQVLEVMKDRAQELQPEQIRAILFLQELGNNEYLHGKDNPYKDIIKHIEDGKIKVADPNFYLQTIEELIPKPPKPIVMAEKEGKGGK